MKSQEIKLSNSLSCAVEALAEVERASAQAGLSREEANLLRLLTEEMISMTTDILSDCRGSLWMEWEGRACRLRLTASAPMEERERAAFLAASKARAEVPAGGLKSRIGALVSGLLASLDRPEFYPLMGPGFLPGREAPVWSMAAWRTAAPREEAEELEGVERSILLGMADDVLVSVRGRGVELTVKKTFDAPAQAALPRFTGLSHVCIFVDDMMAAVSQAAGFLDEAGKGEVSIAFVNVPGARLTLELMQYHYPEGRKEPVIFAANDVSGARHVALKVTNIDEAFLHVKAMPDTRLISGDPAYRPFRISETTPDQVRFFDQDLRERDARNEQTAKILSQVRYFYFIDKYGLQWEFEQGHSDIGD